MKKMTEKNAETPRKMWPLLLIYAVVLVLLINFGRWMTTNQLTVGQRVKESIYSVKDFRNTVREDQLKEEAASRVEVVYKRIPQVPVTIRENLNTFFDTAQKLRINTNLTEEDRINQLTEELGFSREAAQAVLSLGYHDMNYLEVIVNDLLSQWLAAGIRDTSGTVIKDKATEALANFDITDAQRLAGVEILETLIIPNEIVDTQATNALREDAMAEVGPMEVKRGDLLFEKGHVLTASDIEVLGIAGIVDISSGMSRMKSVSLSVVIILLTLMWYYIAQNMGLFQGDRSTLALTFMLDLIMLILPLFLTKELFWLWPVVAMMLLSRTLVGDRLALFNFFYVCAMILVLYGVDVSQLVVLIMVGWSVLWLSNNVERYGRSHMIVISLLASFCGVVLLVALEGSKGSLDWSIWRPLVYLMGNGLLSSIVYIGTLPLWENFFDRLTTERLLELSNPQRKLLRDLVEQAPGTYQHSLIVANLTEACARAIGADGLLCRVGAYYHDIGKTKNPYYFKENQQEDSVHDLLSNYDSAQVIIDHIKVGEKMAREAGLPDRIVQFITEHHGDSLVRYFYNTAVNEGENPNRADYSYPGPKPQSRETAIMMIVDSVEAAARTLEVKNEENFRALVGKIIRGKADEGQFDECPLKLEELYVVKETLVQSLMDMYHERIAYPEEKKAIETTN